MPIVDEIRAILLIYDYCVTNYTIHMYYAFAFLTQLFISVTLRASL